MVEKQVDYAAPGLKALRLIFYPPAGKKT